MSLYAHTAEDFNRATEGRNASTDRKMFSRLFPQSSKEIKFIPASGCSEVERINQAVLAILESNLGWCRFLLVRDRDYMTPDIVQAVRGRAGKNLFILEKHEIENYLLDFDIIAKVLEEIFNQSVGPLQVRQGLHDAACRMAGDVLRDMVAFRLNYKFRPEDFSVPKLFDGKIACKNGSDWEQSKLGELRTALETKCGGIVSDLTNRVGSHNFTAQFDECRTEIESALQTCNWESLFPGKTLLDKFCAERGLGKPPVLHNAIIKEMAAQPATIPEELKTIILSAIA